MWFKICLVTFISLLFITVYAVDDEETVEFNVGAEDNSTNTTTDGTETTQPGIEVTGATDPSIEMTGATDPGIEMTGATATTKTPTLTPSPTTTTTPKNAAITYPMINIFIFMMIIQIMI